MKSIQATEFQNETFHLLEDIAIINDKLVTNPTDKSNVYKSYLYWHEIKCLASLYDLSEIATFAHTIETMFESAHNECLKLTKKNIAEIKESTKQLKSAVQSIIYDQPHENGINSISEIAPLQSPIKEKPSAKGTSKKTKPAPKPSAVTSKILIVEDEPINQALIEANVKNFDESIEIVSVNSAEEGLFHFFTDNFSLIFLDIMMPIIDGNDFIAIVEKNLMKKNVKVPNIVVQTAIQSLSQLTTLAKKECVQEIIRKPIPSDRIQECVKRYCYSAK